MNAMIDLNMNASTRSAASGMYGFKDYYSGTSNPRQGGQISIGKQYTVCIPIISGIMGILAEKYLPLHSLADDIRIEITLEQNDLAMSYAAAYTAGTS